MVSPAATVWPAVTLTDLTVPSIGATISFCIFIASRMITTSPALTAVPASATTLITLPGIGAATADSPAAGAAAGAAFGAGAAAGAGAATGAATGAAFGAAATEPPAFTYSTSTSYAVPFTVMLNFFIYSLPPQI